MNWAADEVIQKGKETKKDVRSKSDRIDKRKKPTSIIKLHNRPKTVKNREELLTEQMN